MTALSDFQILIKPHVTEKSSQFSGDARQVTFKVAPNATKKNVKSAIEKVFGVEVSAVNIARVKGKTVRFGRTQGTKKSWKKAYVTLKQGQEIDLSAVK